MSPDDPGSRTQVLDWYLTATELLDDGDASAAVPLLERAVAAEPHTRTLRQALARAQLQARRYDDAAESYAHLVALDPADAEAQFGLGMANRYLGRHDVAVEALARAVAVRPDLRHYADALQQVRSAARDGGAQ
jgi:tetratricopeptide (TPR) repeat protein